MNTDGAFSLVFDGEPLDEGSMDVRELAPALLGLADTVDEATRILWGEAARVSLRVRASFRRDSIQIDLELVRVVYQTFVDFFSSDQVAAWTNLFSLLGISGFGLVQLVKRSKGKKPAQVLEKGRQPYVFVVFEGEEPIEVDSKLWWLFTNSKARDGMVRLVRPLRREGMRKLTIVRTPEQSVEITSSEAVYFKPIDPEEGKLVTEAEHVLQIVGISFKEGNKWRVSDGTRSFFATISDENFRERIRRGEKFGANDRLRVILRTTQWIEGSDLKATHEIVKLLEHAEGGHLRQTEIDFSGGGNSKRA